jgi:vacuolar-type H+-ATPase subunit F/Vma7
MSEVWVVGEPEMVEGFALAGARVKAMHDPSRVEWLLRETMRARAPAVVVVSESLYELVPEKVRMAAERAARPMYVTLPEPPGWEAVPSREDLVTRIIRRAVGYRIKVKR